MKITFYPRTCIGRWSAWLMISAILVFLVVNSWTGLRAYTPPNLHISADPMLVIFILLTLLGALAGGITGMVALIRYKDHAVLVYLAILTGAVSLAGTVFGLLT